MTIPSERLLQSSGGDELQPGEKIVLGAPPDYPLHKITPCVPTPAEPNPPGSGEPKGTTMPRTDDLELPIRAAIPKSGPAMDARYEGSHDQEEEQRRQVAEGLRSAAPLPSPSEGAGLLKAAEVLLKYRVEGRTRGYLIDTDGSRLALARLADEVKLLRTRATATGGGDNG